MMMNTSAKLYSLPFGNVKTYLFALLFVAGNILLPQLCHLLPLGGPTLLPIYFFTLVAVLSPVVNHLLFAMPAAAVLPAILIKSTLLAVAASIVARRAKDKVLFGGLLAAVLAYQVVGTGFEWLLCGDFHLAAQDFRIGVPGMLLQWLGGYWVLRALARK